jgi:hypothetical protein
MQRFVSHSSAGLLHLPTATILGTDGQAKPLIVQPIPIGLQPTMWDHAGHPRDRRIGFPHQGFPLRHPRGPIEMVRKALAWPSAVRRDREAPQHFAVLLHRRIIVSFQHALNFPLQCRPECPCLERSLNAPPSTPGNIQIAAHARQPVRGLFCACELVQLGGRESTQHRQPLPHLRSVSLVT